MTDNLVQSSKYKDYIINIFVDTNPPDFTNPREDYHISKICFCDYLHEFTDRDVVDTINVNFDPHKDTKLNLHEIYQIEICESLYLYKLENDKFSLQTYNNDFESNKEISGFIFVTRKDLCKLYKSRNLNHLMLQDAKKLMFQELKDFNHFLSGNVYYTQIISPTRECLKDIGGDYTLGDYKSLEDTSKEEIDWHLCQK
jgi:hypothetical protein